MSLGWVLNAHVFTYSPGSVVKAMFLCIWSFFFISSINSYEMISVYF